MPIFLLNQVPSYSCVHWFIISNDENPLFATTTEVAEERSRRSILAKTAKWEQSVLLLLSYFFANIVGGILLCACSTSSTCCYRLKNFYFPSLPKSMSGGYFNSSFLLRKPRSLRWFDKIAVCFLYFFPNFCINKVHLWVSLFLMYWVKH